MAGNNENKKFVVDSSFVLSFLLDERNTDAEEIFKRFSLGEISLFAPDIIYYEVGNALRTRVMQKKLSEKEALSIYAAFFDLYLEMEPVSYEKTLKMALRKNFSFYDASYVYLAGAKNFPLLSLDRKLLKI